MLSAVLCLNACRRESWLFSLVDAPLSSVNTVIGYSGGKELNPTYKRIKDHTESVLVEFDPSVLSFEEVLVEVRFEIIVIRSFMRIEY